MGGAADVMVGGPQLKLRANGQGLTAAFLNAAAVAVAVVVSSSSSPGSKCRRSDFVVAADWNCWLLPDSGSGREDSVVAGFADSGSAGSAGSVVACR